MDRSMRQCGGIFLTTVAIAVRCAVPGRSGRERFWDCLHRRTPVCGNCRKLGCGPALPRGALSCAAADKKQFMRVSDEAGGASGGVAVCVLVFAHGLRHLQRSCGCGSLICLLAVGEATAHSVRQTAFAGRALPMVGMLLLLIWAFSYTLFSLHGADLPIFTETMLSAGGMGCMVK